MSDRLIYMPLGGAGEIGMNAYVYGYGAPGKERLIVVDLGVTFPDMDSTPGVDLIFPDITWLKERRNQIEAIFITHAHEDHVGAVGHLWSELGAPVFARPFTAHLARMKMEDHGHSPRNVKTVMKWPETVDVGPFKVGFAPISHSIPESSALVIDTPDGRVLHSGDFKIDTDPGVGEPFDRDMFKDIAKNGIKALVCDSTNVFSMHPGRSEATLKASIAELIAEAPAMVVATTFASNVARLRTLAEAATSSGRSICLMGRAMRKMVQAALETGVLDDFPSVVSSDEAQEIPRQNLMLLCTGSQGERRAATAQLANGKFQGISLKEGDMVLFSSSTIPGNERDVIRIMNQFSEQGVDVVTDRMGDYHVSGHANRPDLMEMHKIIEPQMVIPMHGEHRHLIAHTALAKELGVEEPCRVHNGDVVRLAPAPTEVIDTVPSGRLYLDGSIMTDSESAALKERRKLSYNGAVFVAIPINAGNRLAGQVEIELVGSPEDDGMVSLTDWALDAVERAIPSNGRLTPERAEHDISVAVRRELSRRWGKKPMVVVSFVSV